MNPKTWSSRDTWILAALCLVGLVWRLHVALSAPWYWDEGYVVEWARSLAAAPFVRAHVGALWEDGFFPLSTSFLAPLSAAPFTLLPWCSPMFGARLWAICLDMLALVLLVLLVRPKENPRLALLTAAAYALLPFAAEFGGRAFYHHFAVALMLGCLALGRDLFDPEKRPALHGASLCAGLAVAGCYWLWWLPLTWVCLLAWKRPKGWGWGVAWTALPPLAVLSVNVLPDPQGAWWSIKGMLHTTGGGPTNPAAWLKAFKIDFAALPFLGVGLAGLAWAAAKKKGPWPWFLVCLAFAILEPVRQRGGFAGAMPYPLMPAAALAALGAAALADSALDLKPWPGRPAAAAILALFFLPSNLAGLDLLSFAPAPVGDLKDYLGRASKPGDLVCGMPHFNWDLRPGLRVCDPFDITAAEGRATGFYAGGAPASRFAYPCGIAGVRYVVMSRIHLMGVFKFEGVALTFLEIERAGWRLVFDDKTFKVYENPRFGVPPDPGTRLLDEPEYYLRARAQALLAGRPDLAAFAESRLTNAPVPTKP